jgi:hypothetical protein
MPPVPSCKFAIKVIPIDPRNAAVRCLGKELKVHAPA